MYNYSDFYICVIFYPLHILNMGYTSLHFVNRRITFPLYPPFAKNIHACVTNDCLFSLHSVDTKIILSQDVLSIY